MFGKKIKKERFVFQERERERGLEGEGREREEKGVLKLNMIGERTGPV